MLAKYCKNKGCSENKGEPCALADHCWLFQWDVSEKNVAVGLVNDTADKSDGKEKETQRGATHAVKTAIQRAITPLEEDEQRNFAEWLDRQGVLWAHIPNERKASLSVLSSLARQGLKKGFPDNFIAVARGKWHGLFIELKRVKKCLSVRSKEQREWIKQLNAAGYKALFCFGAEEAKKAVREYLKEV